MYQQHQQPPRQIPQAPVANMMGGNANTEISNTPTSRSQSFSQPSPTFAPPASPIRPMSVDVCDPVVAKYPYLLAAYKARPKVYQSPYASGGGFTTPFLPNATVPKLNTPRSRSLSEDFLMKRTISQQELLKTHKRQISDNKPLSQNGKFLPERDIQQSPIQTPINSIPPHHSTHHPSPSDSYYPPHQYQYDFHIHNHNPYHQTQHSAYDPQPHSSPQITGLQFQSPQEFQMQMQREVQQHEWAKAQGGFETFFKGLEHAASGHGGGGGGGQTQGSPLKYEMGGGGEMLPMMRDRF